jgi:hypothetical protein
MAGFAIVDPDASITIAATAANTALILIAFRISDLLIDCADSSGISQMTSGTARTVTDGSCAGKRWPAACDYVLRLISISLMKAMQSDMT